MTDTFLNDDFLLATDVGRRLYHDHASGMPIFDYHSHLPVADIADDRVFENITQLWLAGDHYKWRAMRANGVDERFCTGDATDEEKFTAWAATVPYTVRNPLYVWTHLELKRYFGVQGVLLNPQTASDIYRRCSAQVQSKEFSVRNLLRRMRVKVVCTTDDPADDLRHHLKIARDGFAVNVLPTFRPDRAMNAADAVAYNAYLDRLGAAAAMDIRTYADLLTALDRRHAFFHETGCRISDHGMEAACAEEFTEREVADMFGRVRNGKDLAAGEVLKLKTALMLEFGRMDHLRGWTMQLHMGVIRNPNSRRMRELGPDTGFDTIGDYTVGLPLARFLDRLEEHGRLPRTILYNVNPADTDLLAALPGSFQDGVTPGKVQYGSSWWFLDQRDGMEKQLTALSNMGLLSRFVGMLTDSRSFLSYPRHEYFRRTLCKLLGEDVVRGEAPADLALLGGMVESICFNNAKGYFGIPVD
jgi:glucuronate isomerase